MYVTGSSMVEVVRMLDALSLRDEVASAERPRPDEPGSSEVTVSLV